MMNKLLNIPAPIPILVESGAKGMVGDYSTEMVTPIQTHSLNVRIVNDERDTPLEETDGLITFKKGLTIGVRTADCVPILLYAPDLKGVAAIHAGWKGTLGGIVDNALDLLEERGADISRLKVAFGPSIHKEVYEVDFELGRRFMDAGFESYLSYPGGAESRPHLDLEGINMERLMRRGVKRENITPSSYCSYQSINEKGEHLFPSYRRDNGTKERLFTYIRLI